MRRKNPLVSHLVRAVCWSSYPGYGSRRAAVRLGGVRLRVRRLARRCGRPRSQNAYRRYVERGLTEPPENPFRDAIHGWLLGSLTFVDKIRAKVGQAETHEDVPAARRPAAVDLGRIQSAVVGTIRSIRGHSDLRGKSISRDVAAWLSRQLTSCTMRELLPMFGLGHVDGLRNLTRRVSTASAASFQQARKDSAAIRQELQIRTI